ncbi:cryptochrome/photolyase family protein [Nitratireductor indicus]|uniref:cryptochrome/photolyase family protein n=1 Tax=Nitratireductor indicus TaxID=721133 RepID=UPI0028762B16|nr:deoxyribodipyrimidine photo-lyase [Nitratireductor indicus]MDS1135504.1 deoxyribodipyrimidine photo-lyase [Nitratireductor indicus]
MTNDKDTAKAAPDDAPTLVLFRHDLRLADNLALSAAANCGRPVVVAFILDEESEGMRPLGGARRWWLHHSLCALAGRLSDLGAELVLRRGRMAETTVALARETGAATVFWNRRYEPAAIDADKKMKAALRENGIAAESFTGQLLHEPWRIKTGSGGFYRVFTPFWRTLSEGFVPREPADAPEKLSVFKGDVESDRLDDWQLLPTRPDWAGGLRKAWTPGETGAHKRLEAFLDGGGKGYETLRDRMASEATSSLSPHLSHGEITPYQIWQHLEHRNDLTPGDLQTFRKELGWREFCWHLLFHNPQLATKNFNSDFDAFPWNRDDGALQAWQRGRTGYPVVDAAMRQLWQTGWMHNRARMIVASFLVKDLRLDWREGEQWFWDTLVDADPASNPANWQWVAGSGADAAPYFRIFNPVLQGEKFDSGGDYIRRYVPELENLPSKDIHKPWKAKGEALKKAGITLGKTYPEPMVDHATAREHALSDYKSLKSE